MAATRLRFVLAPLALAAVVVACGGKEQAPPPTTLPPSTVAATTTTTTTTTTTLPTPPPAWRAARWGMSRADVLKAFPGQAQRLSPTVDFGPPKAGPADVGIPSLEADGLTWRVLFGFAGEKLDRIQLSALKPGSAACEDVDKAVSAAHAGVPSARDSNQTNVKTDTTSWKGAEAAITLTCTENRVLNFRTLVLEYTPPVP